MIAKMDEGDPELPDVPMADEEHDGVDAIASPTVAAPEHMECTQASRQFEFLLDDEESLGSEDSLSAADETDGDETSETASDDHSPETKTSVDDHGQSEFDDPATSASPDDPETNLDELSPDGSSVVNPDISTSESVATREGSLPSDLEDLDALIDSELSKENHNDEQQTADVRDNSVERDVLKLVTDCEVDLRDMGAASVEEESLFVQDDSSVIEPNSAVVSAEGLSEDDLETQNGRNNSQQGRSMGGMDDESQEGSEFDPDESSETEDDAPHQGRRRARQKRRPASFESHPFEESIVTPNKNKARMYYLLGKKYGEGLTDEESKELGYLQQHNSNHNNTKPRADVSDALSENADASSSDAASQSHDGESGQSEDESASGDKPNPASEGVVAQEKPKAIRRKPAKNAWEYMSRQHEIEDERQARKENRKRKRGKDGGGGGRPQKSRRQADAIASAARRRAAEMLSGLHDIEASINNGSLPSQATIQATNKRDHFSKLKASIPAGCDTRRASTQHKDLKNASMAFGRGKMKTLPEGYRLDGMNCVMKGHQLTAAAWMAKRETEKSAPYGGILADQMGMGKTVVSLALITGVPPREQDIQKFSRATLVIVPNASTARQWQSEIQKHCQDPIGNGAVRYCEKLNQPLGYYENHWIVITTYYELRSQYPSKNVIKELKEKHVDDTRALELELSTKMGNLFQIGWYRVILDEAHAIKNHLSHTALSCWQLRARSYWALTGTPIANKIEEFYPYVKFIGFDHTKSLAKFHKAYTENDRANSNFEALVSLVMYRRTMKDAFLGRKIIDLPETTAYDLWVPFSMEEKIIYDEVNYYFERILSLLRLKQRRGENVTLQILKVQRARFTRLRQTVSHCFNIEKLVRGTLRSDDIEQIRERINKREQPISVGEQIQKPVPNTQGIARFSPELKNMMEREEQIFGGEFDIDELLNLVDNEHTVRNVTCPVCERQPPVEPIQTQYCDHIYCRGCMMTQCQVAKKAVSKKGKKCCVEGCSAELDFGEDLLTFECIYQEALEDQDFKEPGRDANNVQLPRDRTENSFFVASQRGYGVNLPPSSKLTATMAVIQTWLKEAPNDKIIVFTQFLTTGKLLGHMLGLLEVPFLYFYGGISDGAKQKALERFKSNSETRIMLTSLLSGGQSLNLTEANRVIIVEPWWNKTLEQQAFGRVLRHGQEKVTHLVRVFADEIIDKWMYDKQNRKAEIVDHALQDDGHVPMVPPLSELEKLFSNIGKTEE